MPELNADATDARHRQHACGTFYGHSRATTPVLPNPAATAPPPYYGSRRTYPYAFLLDGYHTACLTLPPIPQLWPSSATAHRIHHPVPGHPQSGMHQRREDRSCNAHWSAPSISLEGRARRKQVTDVSEPAGSTCTESEPSLGSQEPREGKGEGITHG